MIIINQLKAIIIYIDSTYKIIIVNNNHHHENDENHHHGVNIIKLH